MHFSIYQVQTARTEPTDYEKGTVKILKSAQQDGPETENRRRKRKRAKGPNPLSCKKKKVMVDGSSSGLNLPKSKVSHRCVSLYYDV